MERNCSKCGIYTSTVPNKSYCKDCGNKMCRDYKKRNREKIAEYNRKYKQLNKDDISQYNRTYNVENRRKIQDRQNEQKRIRRKNDFQFYLSHKLRTNITKIFNGSRMGTSKEYLGCSVEMFEKWIISQFDDEMSLSNRGTYWHIDHLIPISKFDMLDEDDLKKCCHWSNMQPLTATDNLSKKDNLKLCEYSKQRENVLRFAKENNLDVPDIDIHKYIV